MFYTHTIPSQNYTVSRFLSMTSENRLEYSRGASDPNPFSGRPSGSEWGRPQVEWLNIRFEWDCESEKLFTKKSKFEESATIVQYLQSHLDMPWRRITTTDHVKGSLYDRLSDLARVVAMMPEYEHEPVPESSSQDSEPLSEPPPSDHGEPEPSLPSATTKKDTDESSPETRLEKDVENAATAFLFLMINAFESTKADITLDEHREQDFSTRYA